MVSVLGIISKRMASNITKGLVELSIESKILAAFSPMHFEIHNESYKHNVPAGSESHFKVVVVSNSFEGISLIQRHR